MQTTYSFTQTSASGPAGTTGKKPCQRPQHSPEGRNRLNEPVLHAGTTLGSGTPKRIKSKNPKSPQSLTHGFFQFCSFPETNCTLEQRGTCSLLSSLTLDQEKFNEPSRLAQRNVQRPPQSNLGADRPSTLSGRLGSSIPLWGHSFSVIHWAGRGGRAPLGLDL